MSARLHADFVDLAMDNKLATPGLLTILGTPVDLSQVTVDSYIVAEIADHITPWQNCYRSMQLLGGESRFILSTSGHIAAFVNPPGSPKASYQAGKTNPTSPADWLKAPQSGQGAGDRTCWPGSVTGAVRTSQHQQNPAAAGYGRSPQRPAPTSSTTDKELTAWIPASAVLLAPTTSASRTS